MALSRDDLLDRVWVNLDNETRKAYNAGDVDDEQLIQLGVQQGWIPADFSQVEGSASTVPVEDTTPYWNRVAERSAPMREDLGSLLDSLQSGVQSSAAGLTRFGGDMGILPGQDLFLEDDAVNTAVRDLHGMSAENTTAADEVLAKRDGLDWLALRTGQDIFRSLPSIASLVNPAVLAPAAGSYIFGQEYGSGREAGLTPGEALGRAVPMTAAEYAFERLPVGRMADNLFPVLDDLLKVPARVAATAGAEAVTEGLTTQAQLGIDAILARTSEDKEVREFAQSNLPKDIAAWWDETSRSMLAGGGMGAAVGGPMQAIQVAAERGKLAANLLSTLESQQDNDALTRFINQEGRYGLDPFQEAMDQELEAIGSTVEEDALLDPFENDPSANAFDSELLAESNADLAPTEPTPAPVVEAAPVAPVKTPRKRKTVTEKKAEIKSTEQTLDDLIKQITPTKLAQDYEVPGSERVAPTGTQVSDVGKAIVEKLGRGNAQVAARLLVNGNIRLVQSESDIPTLSQAKKTSTAGYYDGNQAYVVADHLDPNNIVGEMLSVAAHELKHAGDLTTDPTLRATLGEFVGEVANEKINRQIEALAEQGNPLAIQAVSSAQGPNYELELPAYFINESRNERAAAPAAGRVLGNIVSAVRTTAKRVVPGDYAVNLDDVAYLSDQLLKTTAVENPNLAEQVRDDAPNFLQMIAGKRSASFAQAQRDGRVYEGKDGKPKFWFSDADSSVLVDGWLADALQRVTDNTAKGVTGNILRMKLSDILQHETLYQEYPELKDMTVNLTDGLVDGALGKYEPNSNAVTLDIALVPDNVIGETTMYDSPLHQVLLHEVQHAVQDIEGFSGGTNPEEAATYIDGYHDFDSNIKAAKQQLVALTNYVLQSAQKNDTSALTVGFHIPSEVAENMMNEATRLMGGPTSYAANPIIREKFLSNVGSHLAKKYANTEGYSPLRSYAAAARVLEEYSAKKQELVNQSFAKYMNNAGEAEARFTEQNIPVRDIARSNLSVTRPTGEGDTVRTANGRAEDGVNPENIYGPDTWVEYRGANYSKATSLSMAINVIPHSVKIGNDPKAMSKLKRAAKRMLVPGSGFPEELQKIMGMGRGLPAALAVDATQLGNNFLSAIKDAAKKRHIVESILREKIGKRIDEIDKLENMDMRVTAVAALDREYPGVGKALNDLREFKLQLTREIIALRKRDPKPLSKKEIATYKKMIQNAERYTTRAYLATFDREMGVLYGKNLLERAKADPNSEEGKTLAGALEYLASNELVIPPEDGLAAMKSSDLRRLHKAWVGSTGRYKGKKGRAAMIANLSKMPAQTKEMIEKKSMEIVRDLLRLNESRGSKLFHTPSMRQQRTILEARTDLPEPLRKLMGEITDPYLRETISLQRMINLVTKTQVLTRIYETGAAEGWWSDTRTEAHQRELSNIAYGPLDGKWINQDIEDAITGTILSMENLDSSLAELINKPDAVMQLAAGAAIKPMKHLMSLQKLTQVVLSPINILWNLGGAIALMGPGQGVSPNRYAKAMWDTAQVLGREISTSYGTKEKNVASAELLRAQVVDSATMGEFRSEQNKAIREEIYKLVESGKYTPGKMLRIVMKHAGEGMNAARQVYAFVDVWVKVATYYANKDFYTEFNKAENMGWTDEYILERAGYEAAGTNISYERSIPLTRVLEQNIPFFMFLTYFSETFRAPIMSYVQAYRDFKLASEAKTKQGYDMAMLKGTSRFVGTTAAVFGVQQAVMWALDNEDEEEKKKRLLDADYMEDKVMFPVGLNKDGNEVMVELQRGDPIGPQNEFMIAIHRAAPDKKPQAAMQAILDMFVASEGVLRTGQVFWDATVHSVAAATGNEGVMEADAKRKRNTILERNYPEAYEKIRSFLGGPGDIPENMVAAAEKLLLPSGIQPFVDAERTQVSEVREGDASIRVPFTDHEEPIHDELRALGYKAYVRDPHMSLTFRTIDYNDAITRLRKEAKDLNERAAVMDPADLLEGLNSIRSQEKDLFDDMHNAYEGFMAFDNTKTKEFNEIVGNKTLAADLRRGKFQSRLVDSDALKRWYDKAKKERGVDRAALNEEYQLLKRLYGDSRRATE